jgi:hypothetical protein
MKTIDLDRYELLKFMPDGVTAEIGVATGRLSKIIIENNKPKKLYLIDAWKNFDIGYYDENMVDDDSHEKRYQSVKEHFATNQSVILVRDYSTEAAKQFEDEFFDWVYIDADHSYDGCITDLKAYNKKVKQTGYIWGHDWLAGTYTKKGFDVNRAVKDFVEENGYIISFITNEKKFASYVISKTQESHDKLMAKLNV